MSPSPDIGPRRLKLLPSGEKVALLGLIVSVVAATAAGIVTSSEQRAAEQLREASLELTRSESDRLHRQLQEILRRDAATGPVDRSASRLAEIERKLKVIEDSLVETPERALSVPMMRRDLNSLDQKYTRDVQVLREDIGRLYTILMWLIGIIVTIAVSVLGVVLSRSRGKQES